VSGLKGAELHIPGTEPGADGKLAVEVGQDQTREIRLSVQLKSALLPPGPVPLEIRATDPATGEAADAQDHFIPSTQ
jgi:hypothetical protein